MLIRAYVLLHLTAVALTGLAAYWDRMGTIPTGPGRLVFDLGIVSVYLIPAFPFAAMIIVCLLSKDRQQNVCIIIVCGLATFAQIVAAMPLVQ